METTNLLPGLTAKDLMSQDRVMIPEHMSMRDASQVLRQAKASRAPVVDERGKCVGILSVTDLHRWAHERGSVGEFDRIPACYYQKQGLVPGSPEAVTCTLESGRCHLQVVQSTKDGRRIVLCRDPNCFCCESQLAGGPESDGEASEYMTTAVASVGFLTPFSELVRIMNEDPTQLILVLDGNGRPAGIVSDADLLSLLSCNGTSGPGPLP